ncbi:hypothetical protein ACFX2I_004833 [Malus domestica]
MLSPSSIRINNQRSSKRFRISRGERSSSPFAIVDAFAIVDSHQQSTFIKEIQNLTWRKAIVDSHQQ